MYYTVDARDGPPSPQEYPSPKEPIVKTKVLYVKSPSRPVPTASTPFGIQKAERYTRNLPAAKAKVSERKITHKRLSTQEFGIKGRKIKGATDVLG